MLRREFIDFGLRGTAAVAAARRAAVAANDKVSVAVVGVGRMGNSHVRMLLAAPGAHIGALCDINQEKTERAGQQVNREKGHTPRLEQDFRRLLDDSVRGGPKGNHRGGEKGDHSRPGGRRAIRVLGPAGAEPCEAGGRAFRAQRKPAPKRARLTWPDPPPASVCSISAGSCRRSSPGCARGASAAPSPAPQSTRRTADCWSPALNPARSAG